MNYLANALPLAGRDTGEISDRFDVAVTPAGYAFSIWGVIYLALGAFVIYQLLPNQASARLDRTRILFLLSCLFNVAWLLAWHNLLIPLSLLIMLCLLAVLFMVYAEVRHIDAAVGRNDWLLRLPFSLYLGWISVATLVNVGVVLYDLGPLRSPALDITWALFALVVLTVAVLFVLRMFDDVVYALVALWASVAIVVANLAQPLVVVAAGLVALLLVGGIGWNIGRSQHRLGG
ncbi:MAG: tryptophan-rich sensory protein [Trueperaceae bacterium]